MVPYNSFISKLKVHLKLSISRLRIVQQKDQALAKQQRRDMASLLEQGKYESARIRVENIIRADLITELHEILELYCELLLARIGILDQSPHDQDLAEPVCSIIYAAPRTEIKELQQTRQLLIEKFGREYSTRAMEKEGVPDRVLRKLRVEPPSQELVESYLKEIARAYDVRYSEDSDVEAEDIDGEAEAVDDDDGGEDGGSGGQRQEAALKEPIPATPQQKELSRATPPRSNNLGMRSPVSIAPPSPSTEKPNPQVKLPGPPELKASAKMAAAASKKKSQPFTPTKAPPAAAANGVAVNGAKKAEGTIPDVDDLEKRFAMLKRT